MYRLRSRLSAASIVVDRSGELIQFLGGAVVDQGECPLEQCDSFENILEGQHRRVAAIVADPLHCFQHRRNVLP